MRGTSGLSLKISSFPGTVLLTDEEGVAVYANEGVVRRTGFSLAEIIDSKPGRLWGGQMPRPFYDEMWQSLRFNHKPFTGIVENHTKGAKKYDELLAIAPLRSSQGAVRYLALSPSRCEDRERFIGEWRSVFAQESVQTRAVLPWFDRWFPTESPASVFPNGLFADWAIGYWETKMRRQFQRRSDDRGLITAAKHDPEQFRALYEKYFVSVRRYFLRHLPGQQDQVLDLTQDTFIRAFERLDGYEIRNATYGTYLLRIAHSVLLNTFRHQTMFELTPERPVPVDDHDSDVAWIWDTPELSTRERLVLSAYYREGFSIREVSRGLEISENATKLLLSRVRKKIRHIFSS